MTMPNDLLAQRMITCQECDGTGSLPEISITAYASVPKRRCPVCSGSGHIPEPAEVWAQRLAGMCIELARLLHHKECRKTGECSEDCEGCWESHETHFLNQAANRLIAAEKVGEDKHGV